MEQKYVNAEMFGGFWEHIMPVIGGRNDIIGVYGTAFLIAPKIAITAAHVIEDYAKMCGIGPDDVYKTQNLDIYMYLLSPDIKKASKGTEHFLFSKEDVKRYDVEYFIAIKDPDIAIISLKGEDWPTHYPLLDARPPRVGQNVFSIGFPLSEANKIDGDIVALGSNPKITSGRIIETFAESMSEYARPFPTSQVHFRTEGGMSGAPVFAVGESGVGKIIGLLIHA